MSSGLYNVHQIAKKYKNLFHVLKPQNVNTTSSFCHISNKMESIILFIVIFIPFNWGTKVLRKDKTVLKHLMKLFVLHAKLLDLDVLALLV